MAKIPLVEEEFWRPAVGLSAYEVSNLGRVREKHSKRTVKTRPDKYGHLIFSAKCKDYVTTKRVARVVGESYGQLTVSNRGHRVRYRDGDSTNCRPGNLEWVSAAEVWERTQYERETDTTGGPGRH